jgi:hypothetical protein
MGSTKEEVAATLANRYNIAAAIRSKNLQTNFENDVSKWNQPALQEATLKVQQLNLPVNMANVAKMYIGDAIGPDKQAKLSAFANYARQAGSKLENSPLGGVNTNSAIQNMANDLISQSLNIASQTIHSTGKGAMRIEAPQGITTQDVMGAGLY